MRNKLGIVLVVMEDGTPLALPLQPYHIGILIVILTVLALARVGYCHCLRVSILFGPWSSTLQPGPLGLNG